MCSDVVRYYNGQRKKNKREELVHKVLSFSKTEIPHIIYYRTQFGFETHCKGLSLILMFWWRVGEGHEAWSHSFVRWVPVNPPPMAMDTWFRVVLGSCNSIGFGWTWRHDIVSSRSSVFVVKDFKNIQVVSTRKDAILWIYTTNHAYLIS